MKIAIGSDDLKTIRRGHFGESKYFMVFDIRNGKRVAEEVRENPFLVKSDADGHHHGEAKNIMKFLNDCHIFIARSMGMHSIPKLVQKGVQPLITKIRDIEQVLETFIAGNTEAFLCFNPQTNKFEICKERLA